MGMDRGKEKGKEEAKTNKANPRAYNKLVRDKIPDIIKKNKQKPVTRIADPDEFSNALKEKILEEAQELVKASSDNQELEELIDILEAVNAYMKVKKVSVDSAERMRKHKLRKRGGFKKAIILEEVQDG